MQGVAGVVRQVGKASVGEHFMVSCFPMGKAWMFLVLSPSSSEDSLAFLSFPVAVAGSGTLLQKMQPGTRLHGVENRTWAPEPVPAGNSQGCPQSATMGSG